MRPLLASLLLLLVLPATASAGGYSVSACFGAENASWTAWRPTPGATAYWNCPGGVVDPARAHVGDGLIARNVGGPGRAARGTTAAMRFDAAPGTVVTGVDFDGQVTTTPGWQAGLWDGSRWLWCGRGCETTLGAWIHQELRGLSTGRLEAVVRCVAVRCARDVRQAWVSLRNVRVYVADGSAPLVGGVRGGLAGGGGWLRGVQDVAFDAADNAGIRLGRIALDGRVVHDDGRACDFTRPLPCANGPTSGSFDTRSWADGAHAVALSAQDAAGNWASVSRTVSVDNTAPVEPAPVLEGGPGWSAARSRTLVTPAPPGQVAPLVRARVKACRVGGRCADLAPRLGARGASVFAGVAAFDGPGEYALRVALEDAAGNVGPFAPPVTLRFDDTPPGAPDVSAADRWQRGGSLPLGSEGTPPVSGVRGYRVRIGGRDAVVGTAIPLDDLPEGGTPVEVRAVSGAGVESTAVRTLLRLDRSAPVVTAAGVPSGDGWSRSPVVVGLRARDQAALSGVDGLHWTIDGAESGAVGDEASLAVEGDGRHAVAWWATDRAGNASARGAATIKVDHTPPETVAFEAPDPTDPTRFSVIAADATSGVAGGRVELRRTGAAAWSRLPSTLDHGRVVARVDDATLRAGAYELRAVVSDAAGNEAVGTVRADGSPATVTLPLRRATTVTLRRRGRTLSGRLTAGGKPLAGRALSLTQRLRGASAWHAVCGRRTVIVARSAGLAATAGPTPSGAAPTAVTPRSSPPGRNATTRRVAASRCPIRTDGAGRVQVQLPKGPSRTVRLAFAGDPLLLPDHRGTRIRTAASGWVHAHPGSVPAGGLVRFAGHLFGGHIPPSGKVVELQARVGAGWRTFATVRADRRGDFRHVHRFDSASAGQTYWVRLRIRPEAAYPFARGTGRPIPIRVT